MANDETPDRPSCCAHYSTVAVVMGEGTFGSWKRHGRQVLSGTSAGRHVHAARRSAWDEGRTVGVHLRASFSSTSSSSGQRAACSGLQWHIAFIPGRPWLNVLLYRQVHKSSRATCWLPTVLVCKDSNGGNDHETHSRYIIGQFVASTRGLFACSPRSPRAPPGRRAPRSCLPVSHACTEQHGRALARYIPA